MRGRRCADVDEGERAYLTDLGEWEEMNRAYLEVLGPRTPARIAVRAAPTLLFGAAVELDCIANTGRTQPDPRFSDPDAEATSWDDTLRALEEAELYWLTTVRADGRPHVTPLWRAGPGAVHFAPGSANRRRAISSTAPRRADHRHELWARGLDVVVEGLAVRITDEELRRLADAYVANTARSGGSRSRRRVRHGAARTRAVVPDRAAKVMPSPGPARADDLPFLMEVKVPSAGRSTTCSVAWRTTSYEAFQRNGDGSVSADVLANAEERAALRARGRRSSSGRSRTRTPR